MTFLAVDKNGQEWIYGSEPERYDDMFVCSKYDDKLFELPNGSIEKLIGKKLTWDDEPVEII
jgi:hypothetical protein